MGREWQGEKYVDRGEILECEPESKLQYSHYSPLSGLPDAPENYHTVTLELSAGDDATRVSLSQDNNPTAEARAHSQGYWEKMLQALKAHVESQP